MSYNIPNTIKETIAQLKEADSSVRIVAGATDLFLGGLPKSVIDISSVRELQGIEEENGLLVIGSAVTHAAAAESGLIRLRAEALAEACLEIGSPQIRNMGTLGGNVVNAAPAADAAVALVALGASTQLIDHEGNARVEAVENLYTDYKCSALEGCRELLVKFIINPCGSGEGSAFKRFAARKALALPMANTAVKVKIEGSKVAELNLVAAPVGPAPTRLFQTEDFVRGRAASEETWQEAAKKAFEEVEVRGSLLRCSAEYRKHLIGILVADALRSAASRAVRGMEGAKDE